MTDDITRLQEQLAAQGYIAILWHIDDVLAVRPDLTAEQAYEVLEACADDHDANLGLTWYTLETCADQLFPASGGE